jgi:hypothetical protein
VKKKNLTAKAAKKAQEPGEKIDKLLKLCDLCVFLFESFVVKINHCIEKVSDQEKN